MADIAIFDSNIPNLNGARWWFDLTVRNTRGTLISGVANQSIIVWKIFAYRFATGSFQFYDGAGQQIHAMTVLAGDTVVNDFYPFGLRLSTGNDLEGFADSGSGNETVGMFYSFLEEWTP